MTAVPAQLEPPQLAQPDGRNVVCNLVPLVQSMAAPSTAPVDAQLRPGVGDKTGLETVPTGKHA